MQKIVIALILCAVFMTGCMAQSIKQHSSMLDAMNGKLTPINYNKTYIFTTFGYPDSKAVSAADGVCTEIWVYKTNLGREDLMFNIHPFKARYMKITIRNNIVTDITFE